MVRQKAKAAAAGVAAVLGLSPLLASAFHAASPSQRLQQQHQMDVVVNSFRGCKRYRDGTSVRRHHTLAYCLATTRRHRVVLQMAEAAAATSSDSPAETATPTSTGAGSGSSSGAGGRPRSFARISDHSLDALRRTARLSHVIGEHVKLTSSGHTSMKGCCPFHDDKTPSLSVDDAKGLYHCFGCGAGGDVIKFVMETERLSFAAAAKTLAEQHNVQLTYEGGGGGYSADMSEAAQAARKAKLAQRDRLLRALQLAAEFYARSLATARTAGAARAHLAARGVSPATALRFQLGYSPAEAPGAVLQRLMAQGVEPQTLVQAGLAYNNTASGGGGGAPLLDRFRGRLIVPIRDARGAVVAFGGRELPPPAAARADAAADADANAAADDAPRAPPVLPPLRKVPKYLNSPETDVFHKGGMLFGLDAARDAIRDEDVAVLVEGYFDVIALHGAGVRCAVGALGTAITPRQLDLAARHARGRRVVLCMDADAAGAKAVERLCEGGALEEAAANGIEVRVADIAAVAPGCKDPSDFVAEAAAAASAGKGGKAVAAAAAPAPGAAAAAAGDRFRAEVLRVAKPWTVWYTDRVLAAHDHGGDAAAFKACVDKLTTFLSTLADPADRTNHVYRVAAALGRDNLALRLQLEADLMATVAAKEKRRNALRRRVDAALSPADASSASGGGGGGGGDAGQSSDAAVMAHLAAGGGGTKLGTSADARALASRATKKQGGASSAGVNGGGRVNGSAGAAQAQRQQSTRTGAATAARRQGDARTPQQQQQQAAGRGGGAGALHAPDDTQQQRRALRPPKPDAVVGKTYAPLPPRPKAPQAFTAQGRPRRAAPRPRGTPGRPGGGAPAASAAAAAAYADPDGVLEGRAGQAWQPLDYGSVRLPQHDRALLNAEQLLLMLMVHDVAKRRACADAIARSALDGAFSAAPRQWLFDALMDLPPELQRAGSAELLQHLAPRAPPGYFALSADGSYDALPSEQESAVLNRGGGAAAPGAPLNALFARTELTRVSLEDTELSLQEALLVVLRSQAVARVRRLRAQLTAVSQRIAELRAAEPAAAVAADPPLGDAAAVSDGGDAAGTVGGNGAAATAADSAFASSMAGAAAMLPVATASPSHEDAVAVATAEADADAGSSAAADDGAAAASPAVADGAAAAAAVDAAAALLEALRREQQDLHARVLEAQSAVDEREAQRQRLSAAISEKQEAAAKLRARAATASARQSVQRLMDDDGGLRFVPRGATDDQVLDLQRRAEMERAAEAALANEPSPNGEVRRREKVTATLAEYEAIMRGGGARAFDFEDCQDAYGAEAAVQRLCGRGGGYDGASTLAAAVTEHVGIEEVGFTDLSGFGLSLPAEQLAADEWQQ